MSYFLFTVCVLPVWAFTFLATAYMAVFHLPLSLIQTVLLVATSPAKLTIRLIAPGLFLWFVVMTFNQCLAFAWLLGYALIKSWAYSTSFGDVISALYFAPSAVASVLLVRKFRHHFYDVMS